MKMRDRRRLAYRFTLRWIYAGWHPQYGSFYCAEARFR